MLRDGGVLILRECSEVQAASSKIVQKIIIAILQYRGGSV